MTELRKRMIESLQLRGMSERTQEAYVRAVRQLAQHYKKSPDLISEEELRQYFLYIKNVKKHPRPLTTVARCWITSASSARRQAMDKVRTARSRAPRQVKELDVLGD